MKRASNLSGTQTQSSFVSSCMQFPNPQVDAYIADGCGRCAYHATDRCKVRSWQMELETLRQILLETPGLTETLKWGVAVYTHNGKNVVNLSALKDYCALGFFKGALLPDPEQHLRPPGPHSQATRLWEFRSLHDIHVKEAAIRQMLLKAVEVEQARLQIEFKKALEPLPDELLAEFEEDMAFAQAFYALTPGRQRGYVLHFSQPKSSSSRSNRIAKCKGQIMRGQGLHDAYKSGNKPS